MKHALKVIEFEAVLERLAHRCETELAAAQALALQPTFDTDEVWTSLNETAEAHKLLADSQPPSLARAKDLRQAFIRAQKGGGLSGEQLFQAADALNAMRGFRESVRPRQERYLLIWKHARNLPDQPKIEGQILHSVEPSGEVKDSASPALGTLRSRKRTLTNRIHEKIQSYTTGKTRELLSDPIFTVRDGRYVVPVKAENRGKLRGIVHDTSGSGQTLFIEPEEVLQLGNALREVEANEREEVQRVLGELSAKLGAVADDAVVGIEAAADIDLLLAKARLAYDMKSVAPDRSNGVGLKIQTGRHPLLDPETAVPLNLEVGWGNEAVLITGPNTGGKTVAIKTVGLFAAMAQSGMMVPATHVKLGPFSQIWADIGDEQSLQQSLSTFSGHIKNIAEAVRFLKKGALVLFDEIGAGTDPAEGAALAKAILMELKNRGAVILASTHYGELKAFAYNVEGFSNAAMEFDQKTLRPTYRLIMGAPGASHALKIAERYGLPKGVIEAAVSNMSADQQQVGTMLEKLEEAQRQARIAQGEADRRMNELKKAEQTAARKLAEAEEIRKTVHSRASETIESALREIRLEAAELFEELKNAPREQKTQEAVRSKLKGLQEVGQDFAAEYKSTPARSESALIEKGMSVKISGYTQIGIVLDAPKAGQVNVQMGSLKLKAKVADLEPVQAQKAASRTGNLGLHKAQTALTEIHLRAMRAEDAQNELERFLDDAVLAGLPQVRIVHGKGEGILRKLTQDYLRSHPGVKSYREADANEGGQGATVAYLK